MLPSMLFPTAVCSYMLASSLVSASTFTVDSRKELRQTGDLLPRSTAEAPVLEFSSDIAYLIEFEIGTPPQKLAGTFDTGSSDVWVPTANTTFCKTGSCGLPKAGGFGHYNSNDSSSYKYIASNFSVFYGSEAAVGDYGMDTLTLGGTRLDNFTFGIARRAGVSDIPVFGMGMDSIQSAVLNKGLPPIPGVLDRMVQAGLTDRRVFSLYLNSQESGNGAVLFGGIDHAKYTGNLTTLPMAMMNGIYDRYRLDLTSITFTSDNGDVTDYSTPNMAAPAILDSGVSALVLPAVIVQQIVAGFGAVPENGGQTFYTDCAYRNSTGNLTFQLGGSTGPKYDIPVTALLGDPVMGQTFPNGVPACRLWVQAGTELTANSLGGYSLGDSFLRTMYVVYDIDNYEISLAKANWDAPSKGSPSALPSGTSAVGVLASASGTPTMLPLPSAPSVSGSASGSTAATGASSASKMITAITGVPASASLSSATTAAAAAASSNSSSSASMTGPGNGGLVGICAMLSAFVLGM